MSYFHIWGLNEEPFSTSPDPKYLYLTPKHRLALTQLEIGIRLRKGLSVILGPIGSGKTTLSRALCLKFDDHDSTDFYYIFDPAFRSEFDFLHSLARIFNIHKVGRSASACKIAIQNFLFDQAQTHQRTVVLVIDEAQKLSLDNLESLRTLLNYESNQFKFLQLVLLGQPELYPKIFQMPNFMDRIFFKLALEPLTVEQVQEFVYFRLSKAGSNQPSTIIDSKSIYYLWEISGGLPRKITHLCHLSMSRAIAMDQNNITIGIIQSVIQEDQKFHEQFSIA